MRALNSALDPVRRAARSLALRAALAALPALLLPRAASALELHGVDVPAGAQLGGRALLLNGAGTRYFVFFKVYVAALYLPQKTASAQAALDMPGPKALRLVMLRDISGKELGDKLTEGIRNNVSPQEFSGLIPGLARLGGLFAQKRELKSGETVMLRFVPGQGTTIDIDGLAAGAPYAEPDFFNALLKIWLGKEPADARLKRALLGDVALRD